MSPKDIKAIIKLMRANGVTHLKAGDVELTLAHEALFPKKESMTFQETEPIQTTPAWHGMSDEQIAMWTGGPNVENGPEEQ